MRYRCRRGHVSELCLRIWLILSHSADDTTSQYLFYLADENPRQRLIENGVLHEDEIIDVRSTTLEISPEITEYGPEDKVQLLLAMKPGILPKNKSNDIRNDVSPASSFSDLRGCKGDFRQLLLQTFMKMKESWADRRALPRRSSQLDPPMTISWNENCTTSGDNLQASTNLGKIYDCPKCMWWELLVGEILNIRNYPKCVPLKSGFLIGVASIDFTLLKDHEIVDVEICTPHAVLRPNKARPKVQRLLRSFWLFELLFFGKMSVEKKLQKYEGELLTNITTMSLQIPAEHIEILNSLHRPPPDEDQDGQVQVILDQAPAATLGESPSWIRGRGQEDGSLFNHSTVGDKFQSPPNHQTDGDINQSLPNLLTDGDTIQRIPDHPTDGDKVQSLPNLLTDDDTIQRIPDHPTDGETVKSLYNHPSDESFKSLSKHSSDESFKILSKHSSDESFKSLPDHLKDDATRSLPIDDSSKKQRLTEAEFSQLAEHLSIDSMKTIAWKYFHIESPTIDNLEYKHPGNAHHIAVELFVIWRNKTNGTRQKLAEILYKASDDGLIDSSAVEKILKIPRLSI